MSLAEQLGNIGSEASRSLQYKENNSDRIEKSLDRMLELFDMSLNDPKYQYPLDWWQIETDYNNYLIL